MSNIKRACIYGKLCYRKNPAHFAEYSHPISSPGLTESISLMADEAKRSADDEEVVSARKKAKIAKDVPEDDDSDVPGPSADAVKKAHGSSSKQSVGPNAFHFYLAKVDGLEAKWNRNAIGISDILGWEAENLVTSAQFNYMFDVEWLVSKYPSNSRNKPLLLVSGDSLTKDVAKHANIQSVRARLEMAYGTHHTYGKMMLLRYTDGVRVVVHTANLIPQDWALKTQGVYWSPLFPFLDADVEEKTGDYFKHDLCEYLSAYKLKQLDDWIKLLKICDMTSAKVRVIGSVPGRHAGQTMKKWGHLKLRKLLSEAAIPATVDPAWSVVAQFSSIGSLGSTPENWLQAEFLETMQTTPSKSGKGKAKLKLIFPSVENVRWSLEGYCAGGSLPYSQKTAVKQTYLKKFLHPWQADVCGRTHASPHIKSYLRLHDGGDAKSQLEFAWFLLTSANLSKAAWGAFEKNGSQLMIRSYELGLLFLPEFNEGGVFSSQTGAKNYFPLPFDVPLTAYGKEDEPWMWDIKYDKEDSHDRTWNPGH